MRCTTLNNGLPPFSLNCTKKLQETNNNEIVATSQCPKKLVIMHPMFDNNMLNTGHLNAEIVFEKDI